MLAVLPSWGMAVMEARQARGAALLESNASPAHLQVRVK